MGQTNRNSSIFAMIGGILFAILAGQLLVEMLSQPEYYLFWWRNWVELVAYLLIAIFLLLQKILPKKANIALGIGFALLSVPYIFSFFSELSWLFKHFYFNALIYTLMNFVMALCLASVCIIIFISALSQQKERIIRGFFPMPFILSVLSFLINAYSYFDRWILYGFVLSDLFYLAFHILLLTGIILTVLAVSLPFLKKVQVDNFANCQSVPSAANHMDGYCSLAVHILLLLFTFGIWELVWIYRTTRFLNCVKSEEERNPTKKLLLCMFVPFYSIYWTYKSAQRIDQLARERGILSDLAAPCLILAIFIGIVPPILMQSKINSIVMPKVANISCADELKKYKELLDSGAITLEEFEAKKKQLLGL